MHQNSILRQMRFAALAAAALAFGATAAGAQDITKCRQAIVKNGQKYASSITKAQQKCEEGRLKGKILTACSADLKTTDKINKAATKLSDGVVKACTGVALVDMGFAAKVTRCVGGNGAGDRCVDTEDCKFAPVAIGPEDGICTPTDECPTFLNGRLPGDDTCEIALSTPASVADCLECAANAKVGSLINTFYASLNAFSADKTVQKCQIDIGKRTAKFFDAIEKSLAKCEDAVLKAGAGTCPDLKATDKIAKSLTKLTGALTKTCASGATISNAAAAGKIFGAAPAFGACGVAGAQTTPGLVNSLSCLAQNAAECDVALSLGSNACSTALCGNAQIDAGETCDDGNTTQDSGSGPADICPSDCSVNTCANLGTQSVTISIQAPANLISSLVLLSYDDAKVAIPGINSDPAVLAAVSSLDFATTPRDNETSLRIIFEDPSVVGVAPGVAGTVTFSTCAVGPITAADFGCMVIDAGNPAFENITGATCTVTVL